MTSIGEEAVERCHLWKRKPFNDAGAWSAANLKQASNGAAEDIRATVTAALSRIHIDISAVRKAKLAAFGAAGLAILLGGAFLVGGIGFWLAGR